MTKTDLLGAPKPLRRDEILEEEDCKQNVLHNIKKGTVVRFGHSRIKTRASRRKTRTGKINLILEVGRAKCRNNRTESETRLKKNGLHTGVSERNRLLLGQ